jgi:hypothetical protein
MKTATNQVRIQKLVRQVQQIALMQRLYFFYSLTITVSARLGLTLFLLAGLLGCSHLSLYGLNTIGVNITPIRRLQRQPQQDHKTTVYIKGKVEKQVPLLQQRAYQISDSTGKIWVLTRQNGDFNKGDEIVIQGQIRYKTIPIGGRDYGEVYLDAQ